MLHGQRVRALDVGRVLLHQYPRYEGMDWDAYENYHGRHR